MVEIVNNRRKKKRNKIDNRNLNNKSKILLRRALNIYLILLG